MNKTITANEWHFLSQVLMNTTIKAAEAKAVVELVEKVEHYAAKQLEKETKQQDK